MPKKEKEKQKIEFSDPSWIVIGSKDKPKPKTKSSAHTWIVLDSGGLRDGC